MAEDTVGTMTPENMSEQTEIRLNKLRALQEAGRNPYAITHFEVTHASDAIVRDYDALENAEVTIAGRLMSRRVMGKASFAHLLDCAGEIQIYVKRDDVGEDVYKDFKDWDIGDMLGVKGFVFKTKTGEISVHAKELTLLTKSLHPLPEKFHGLTNTDTRYRQRYLDLIVNPEVKDTFVKRSQILRELRAFLDGRGFLEVDTPILTPFEIGASARPFYTHHNALDIDLYLRIACELYLKRLIVGGFEGVYEFSKNFRNEGMDKNHNPEFTCMELYVSYKDYKWMMCYTEKLLERIALDVNGTTKVVVDGKEIDFKAPYRRVTMLDSIKEKTGYDLTDKTEDEIRAICKELKLDSVDETFGKGKMIDEIFGEFCEGTYIQPTFIIDYPIEMSPLTKKHRDNPNLTERFELMVNGKELAYRYRQAGNAHDRTVFDTGSAVLPANETRKETAA